MSNHKKKFQFIKILLLLFLAFPVISESNPELIANYDVIFSIEKEMVHERTGAPAVHSRASRVTKTGVKVSSGENIRLDISDKYNIDLKKIQEWIKGKKPSIKERLKSAVGL